ncbi:uncharacterized protein LOC132201142 [Neocloeon triangulifer]|uniref:uncharacterized protein LOC132201142 n=1 Tax=Neocloeon triangulifer TaxID=2078957 RepID=UPI00286EC422|nr:uncharacterized protein LOC132201142 [Neocloeon triangulifer]
MSLPNSNGCVPVPPPSPPPSPTPAPSYLGNASGGPSRPSITTSPVGTHEDNFKTLIKKTNDEVKKDTNSCVKGIRVQRMNRILNTAHWHNYSNSKSEVASQCSGRAREMHLFLTSPHMDDIVNGGLDFHRDAKQGNFGNGLYLTESVINASRFSFPSKFGCDSHKNPKCETCVRKMLVCRAVVGKSFSTRNPTTLPQGFHSVQGMKNGKPAPIYVIFNPNQVIPAFYVEFTTNFGGGGRASNNNNYSTQSTQSQRGGSGSAHIPSNRGGGYQQQWQSGARAATNGRNGSSTGSRGYNPRGSGRGGHQGQGRSSGGGARGRNTSNSGNTFADIASQVASTVLPMVTGNAPPRINGQIGNANVSMGLGTNAAGRPAFDFGLNGGSCPGSPSYGLNFSLGL